MSIFGSDYQRGWNAAQGQQLSEQICAGLSAGLNRRREQDRAQQQHAAQQGLMQAMQMENLRLQQENARIQQENALLRRDNARYERFANWAMNTIDERDISIADLQSDLNKWRNMSLQQPASI